MFRRLELNIVSDDGRANTSRIANINYNLISILSLGPGLKWKQTIDETSANRDKINILGWASPKQTQPGFADRRYSFNLIRRNFHRVYT